jgi:hypothetical protein
MKADLPLRALDDLVDHLVGQRPPDLAAPQVHEHEVAVQIAELLVHVVVPQLHQLRRDRHPALGAALAARQPRRILACANHNPPLPRDHVLMARTQRLANPHPGGFQQREHAPVT